MKLTKAVITAAGADQRMLPAQTLVDRDGRRKTALRLLVEEILSAGIDEIAVVAHPGDADVCAQLTAGCRARLTFVEQAQPRAAVAPNPVLEQVAADEELQNGTSPGLAALCSATSPRSAKARAGGPGCGSLTRTVSAGAQSGAAASANGLAKARAGPASSGK